MGQEAVCANNDVDCYKDEFRELWGVHNFADILDCTWRGAPLGCAC